MGFSALQNFCFHFKSGYEMFCNFVEKTIHTPRNRVKYLAAGVWDYSEKTLIICFSSLNVEALKEKQFFAQHNAFPKGTVHCWRRNS
jgi:hypothetical protein